MVAIVWLEGNVSYVINIPHKLTEFQLLKILEKFGPVSQFDFLYNISDTGNRTPRGYCFATFSSEAVGGLVFCRWQLCQCPFPGRVAMRSLRFVEGPAGRASGACKALPSVARRQSAACLARGQH